MIALPKWLTMKDKEGGAGTREKLRVIRQTMREQTEKIEKAIQQQSKDGVKE